MFLLHTTALLSLIQVMIPKIATSICCEKKQCLEIIKLHKTKSNNNNNRN